ncbi:hypothetical protein EPUS_05263 [Endocarpon pusillum Z07020]|uniref:SUN domain-containing protein n=1 Tax=Endocarpon pusillum (strain Z07020 / HMAS-L-300199) TaxID=1263415 RepID=U1FTV5_ENDPU|nr:uncharacterized protein EPUS_05263 [Endocarpon pusillum Z07020]ERF68182.1 hypothetical protein EPUS_05263 [Endocarpon pusillum Z07020]
MQHHCLASKPQHLLLFLLLWIAGVLYSNAAETSVPSASAASSSPTVCPYRTVNYITHSLAQQCLTTSRPARSSTTTPAASRSSNSISQISLVLSTAAISASTLPSSVQTVDERHLDKSTTAIKKPTASAPGLEEEADAESPLGKDNFLSFEEWKRRNLDKYGQSADQIGKPKKHDNLHARRQPVNVLDTLGDEAEIDLDFSAFAPEKPQIVLSKPNDMTNSEARGAIPGKEMPKTQSRSKDAGMTFKERFNYASFDCAATILKTNAKASGSSAVLVENKDSYMLNECSVENKFLILELCEDILIDTIVLANFEFFSSIFRTFRVSVTDRYPVKLEKWKVLGTFEARNTREVQAFLVENPLIWTKFVRIEFLTHYGNEFYCPVSLVRVHGTTMLEDYRHDEDTNKAEDRDDEDDQVTEAYGTTETAFPEAVAEILVEHVSSKLATQEETNLSANESNFEDVKHSLDRTSSSPHHDMHTSNASVYEPLQSPQTRKVGLLELFQQRCLADKSQADHYTANPIVHRSAPVEVLKQTLTTQKTPTITDGTKWQQQASACGASQATTSQHPPIASGQDPPAKFSAGKSSVQPSTTSALTKATSSQGTNSSKPLASSTQPPPSNPTIQESFFKSVQKRLQMLESNSTLSLQYIEEQSRILREAFNKVEQRQLAKTTKFLDYLNGTVFNELRDFKQQYDQLWQSTVIELETQREQSQREVIALNTRLSILADELVFQKRMAVLQCILVLLCIGLVLFPRGAMNSYLEHPLLQNMLTRSATFRKRGAFLDTPNLSSESTQPSPSYKAQAKAAYSTLQAHQRNLSEDFQDGAETPALAYSPPTPSSYDARSEIGEREDEHIGSDC